jgi:hypothetical protein
MSFEERVVAAWASVRPPERNGITDHRCDECDEITAYFGGKRWEDLMKPDDLGFHADALFLFSEAAFHYYLPAYMFATLRNPDAVGVVPDNIAASFRLEVGAASRDRLDRFDAPQRVLVGEFLEMLLPELGAADQGEMRIVSELLRGG